MEVKNPFGFPLTVQGIVETYQEQVKQELPKWQAQLARDGGQLRRIEEAILDFCVPFRPKPEESADTIPMFSSNLQ